MPELDFSFMELPSYMRSQPPDTTSFLRAYELAQQRRAQQEDPLLPLKKAVYEQNLQLGSQKIAASLKDRQDQIENEAGLSELNNFVGRAFQGDIAGEPGTMAGALKIISKHKTLPFDPRTKEVLAQLDAARKVDQAAEKFEKEQDFKAQTEAFRAETGIEKVEIKAEADIERAKIRADSQTNALLQKVTNWKDHARQSAFRAGIARVAKAYPPSKDPLLYAQKAQELYDALLPEEETKNETPQPLSTPSTNKPTSKPPRYIIPSTGGPILPKP